MEVNPPPYNPQVQGTYTPHATAPTVDDMYGGNPAMLSQQNFSPTFPQQPQQAALVNQHFFDSDPTYSNQLPPYSPGPEISPPIPSRQPLSNVSTTPPAVVRHAEIIPLRCKSGNVEIGIGDTADVDQIRAWKSQYIEVQDGILLMSPSRDTRSQSVSISLKNRFVFVAGKRLVAIQGGGTNTYVIKASTELRAQHWLLVLSQYCFVAPMMEGYCDKLSRGKKVFEERYIRLSTNGVLSWFGSDSEESERRGSIQLRGVPCIVDNLNTAIVHVQIEPRAYQFRFNSAREASLWLAAFRWHYGRKPLRKASVPLRNKAK